KRPAMIRTRSRYRYNVPGKPIASGGIEYGCPSCITTPVGETLTGIRSARSAGATFSGRRRPRSSAMRAAGGTPVALDGRVRCASVSQSRSCRSRSARSRKRRCLKKEFFHPADEIFDAAFLLRPIGPAHVDADAEIEGHTSKRRIPFGHHPVAPPLQRDRLRPIENSDERNATKGGEMLNEHTHERVRAFIPHQCDLDPP